MSPVPALLALTTAALAVVLARLGRRAWITLGEIEQTLADADTELAHRD